MKSLRCVLPELYPEAGSFQIGGAQKMSLANLCISHIGLFRIEDYFLNAFSFLY
jgi:hypothetical protein